MKSIVFVHIFIMGASVPILSSRVAYAQEASSNRVSIGVIIGDPLGATIKYRFGASNSLDVGFGPDYFGSPRLQLDYVWEFNIFHSNVVTEYAGPGLGVAFANGVTMFFSHEHGHENFDNIEDKGFALGGRTIFGFNFGSRTSHIQYFVEGGPLIAFKSYIDIDLDGAIGFRYSL